MRKRMLWLTERQDRALDEESRRTGIPASEIVRRLLRERYTLPEEIVRPGQKYIEVDGPTTDPTRAEH